MSSIPNQNITRRTTSTNPKYTNEVHDKYHSNKIFTQQQGNIIQNSDNLNENFGLIKEKPLSQSNYLPDDIVYNEKRIYNRQIFKDKEEQNNEKISLKKDIKIQNQLQISRESLQKSKNESNNNNNIDSTNQTATQSLFNSTNPPLTNSYVSQVDTTNTLLLESNFSNDSRGLTRDTNDNAKTLENSSNNSLKKESKALGLFSVNNKGLLSSSCDPKIQLSLQKALDKRLTSTNEPKKIDSNDTHTKSHLSSLSKANIDNTLSNYGSNDPNKPLPGIINPNNASSTTTTNVVNNETKASCSQGYNIYKQLQKPTANAPNNNPSDNKALNQAKNPNIYNPYLNYVTLAKKININQPAASSDKGNNQKQMDQPQQQHDLKDVKDIQDLAKSNEISGNLTESIEIQISSKLSSQLSISENSHLPNNSPSNKMSTSNKSNHDYSLSKQSSIENTIPEKPTIETSSSNKPSSLLSISNKKEENPDIEKIPVVAITHTKSSESNDSPIDNSKNIIGNDPSNPICYSEEQSTIRNKNKRIKIKKAIAKNSNITTNTTANTTNTTATTANTTTTITNTNTMSTTPLYPRTTLQPNEQNPIQLPEKQPGYIDNYQYPQVQPQSFTSNTNNNNSNNTNESQQNLITMRDPNIATTSTEMTYLKNTTLYESSSPLLSNITNNECYTIKSPYNTGTSTGIGLSSNVGLPSNIGFSPNIGLSSNASLPSNASLSSGIGISPGNEVTSGVGISPGVDIYSYNGSMVSSRSNNNNSSDIYYDLNGLDHHNYRMIGSIPSIININPSYSFNYLINDYSIQNPINFQSTLSHNTNTQYSNHNISNHNEKLLSSPESKMTKFQQESPINNPNECSFGPIESNEEPTPEIKVEQIVIRADRKVPISSKLTSLSKDIQFIEPEASRNTKNFTEQHQQINSISKGPNTNAPFPKTNTASLSITTTISTDNHIPVLEKKISDPSNQYRSTNHDNKLRLENKKLEPESKNHRLNGHASQASTMINHDKVIDDKGFELSIKVETTEIPNLYHSPERPLFLRQGNNNNPLRLSQQPTVQAYTSVMPSTDSTQAYNRNTATINAPSRTQGINPHTNQLEHLRKGDDKKNKMVYRSTYGDINKPTITAFQNDNNIFSSRQPINNPKGSKDHPAWTLQYNNIQK